MEGHRSIFGRPFNGVSHSNLFGNLSSNPFGNGSSSSRQMFKPQTAEIEKHPETGMQRIKRLSTSHEAAENSSKIFKTGENANSEIFQEAKGNQNLSIFRPANGRPIPEAEPSFPKRQEREERVGWKNFPEELSYPEEQFDDFKFRFNMSLSQRSKISFGEIYKCADDLRQSGNRKFKFDKFLDAVERYEKAMKLLDDAVTTKKEDAQARLELQYKLFTNIAVCHLRLGDPSQAIVACKAALGPGMPEPKNGKVYYRYASASHQLRKYEDASKYVGLALMFDPQDFNLLNFQKKILMDKEEEQYVLRKLYQRMARG